MQKESQRDVMEFIKEIMEKLFVPIFVFSGVDIEEVKNGEYLERVSSTVQI